MKNKYFNKGFTLIELLVVISIIGILATLGIISFTGAQKQARDTQRKSDLKQYQVALEAYANKNGGMYPSMYEPDGLTILSKTEGPCGTILSINCASDPKENTLNEQYYRYRNYNILTKTEADTSYYVLSVRLETKPDTYWIVCSDGKSGESKTETPEDVNCPLDAE